MQPYFMPYIGYFQLIAHVDKFIIYDDVNYINRGWVNRNRMLLNGSDHMFTIPLVGASQNKLIKEIEVSPDSKWRSKMVKSFELAYRKAPHFEEVKPLIDSIVSIEERNLSKFIVHGLREVCGYLSIDTPIEESSSKYDNRHLSGMDRILDICRLEGASAYTNPINGHTLYSFKAFEDQAIELSFIAAQKSSYPQFNKDEFVPFLSILDHLMFNSKNELEQQLGKFVLLSSEQELKRHLDHG